jgi:AAA15 family ATPase/GTPase
MLASFFVRNFRSILELTLDFSYAEGKAPNRHSTSEIIPFFEAAKGKRFVPCMAYFGANASGKSNLIKAFGTLHDLVWTGKPLADLYEPNLLNQKFHETTFDLSFYLDADRFDYRVSFSASSITEESLRKNGIPIFSFDHTKAEFDSSLLSAAYSHEKLADIFRVECTDGEGRQIKSFFHRIGRAYAGLHPDIRKAFHFVVFDVEIFGNDFTFPLPTAVDILATAMGGDSEAALREITDVVRSLDIDITSIDFAKVELKSDEPAHRESVLRRDPDSGARHAVRIHSTHKDATGSDVVLNFLKHESAGTQRLASLVGLILRTLKTGGVFIIDELECSLHPLLMRELVLLFKKRRLNPKGAQVIFTSHNTDILDDSILRISEIALVRKTAANGTLVRRLVDARNDGDDIRNVTNFRKQYLAGFYSAIPHPAL